MTPEFVVVIKQTITLFSLLSSKTTVNLSHKEKRDPFPFSPTMPPPRLLHGTTERHLNTTILHFTEQLEDRINLTVIFTQGMSYCMLDQGYVQRGALAGSAFTLHREPALGASPWLPHFPYFSTSRIFGCIMEQSEHTDWIFFGGIHLKLNPKRPA